MTPDAATPAAVIRTARLALRPMTRADAPAFHDLVTRPEVARFLYLFHPAWTLAGAEAFLNAGTWRGTLTFRLAIEGDGQWAGWIGVGDEAEPEIFGRLLPEHAGRGLGSEAVAAFCAFLFDSFPVPALTAGVFIDNPASARLLEKQVFRRIAEDLHPSRGRLAPAPLWVYRLERPSRPVAP
jgi:RimJ/RimL family protein N-acetyltransferase